MSWPLAGNGYHGTNFGLWLLGEPQYNTDACTHLPAGTRRGFSRKGTPWAWTSHLRAQGLTLRATAPSAMRS